MVTAVQLKDLVVRASTLTEALRTVASSQDLAEGVLRIIAGPLSGRIAILGKRIEGAVVTTSAEVGVAALQKLLTANTGVFQFLEMNSSESALHQQKLEIEIIEILGQVAPAGSQAPTVGSDDPIMEIINSTRSLSSQQVDLLNMYKSLATKEDQQSFLQQNPSFQNFTELASLTPEQIQLLSLYSKLSSTEDKKSFLKQNREFQDIMHDKATLSEDKKRQLDFAKTAAIDAAIKSFLGYSPDTQVHPEQMQMLRAMYHELASQVDRQSFLSKHPGFEDLMSEGNGLTDLQRQDLIKARQAAVEKDLNSFIAFQKQLLGEDHPPLSPDQLEMLRAMYIDMASEQARLAFLERNPALSDNSPVMRGSDALTLLKPDDDLSDLPEIDEAEERSRQLAALGLTAIDPEIGFERIEDEQESLARRFRGLGTQKLKKEQIQAGLSWAAVFIVIICMGFLAFAYMNRNAPPPVYLEEGELDDELLSHEIDEALKEEIPSILTPAGMRYGGAQGSRTTSAALSTEALEAIAEAKKRLELGERLEAEGKFELAAEAYLDCIEKYPTFIPARIALIKLYIKMKKFQKAREMAVRSIKYARSQAEREYLFALLKSILGDPTDPAAVLKNFEPKKGKGTAAPSK